MLGKLAKMLLVLTSVAPITLTWAYADYRVRGPKLEQASALLVSGFLIVACVLLMKTAKRHLPVAGFQASGIRHADSEVLGFLIAYLLPLVSTKTTEFDYGLLGFVGVLVAAVVWASEAYSFNPLLTLLGYHFHEVTSHEGVAYILITRHRIRRAKDVTLVAELSGAVLLDSSERSKRL